MLVIELARQQESGGVSVAVVQCLQEPLLRRILGLPVGRYQEIAHRISESRRLGDTWEMDDTTLAEYNAPGGARILLTEAGEAFFTYEPTYAALSMYAYAQQNPGRFIGARIPLNGEGTRFKVGTFPIEAMESRVSEYPAREVPDRLLARQQYLRLLSKRGILPRWIQIPEQYGVVETTAQLALQRRSNNLPMLPHTTLLRKYIEHPTLEDCEQRGTDLVTDPDALLSEVQETVVRAGKENASGALRDYFQLNDPRNLITKRNVLIVPPEPHVTRSRGYQPNVYLLNV